jgi:tetratricopeptide (TPR) repeat protein
MVIRELDQAIALDQNLSPALASRAELRMEDRQYQQALADLDRILRNDSNNAAALHDRALAKLELGDFYDASQGFTEAISNTKPGENLENYYQNRADAYTKTEFRGV